MKLIVQEVGLGNCPSFIARDKEQDCFVYTEDLMQACEFDSLSHICKSLSKDFKKGTTFNVFSVPNKLETITLL